MTNAPIELEQSEPSREPLLEADNLITYSASMFAENTFGRIYFPPLLEGRIRPDILNDRAARRFTYTIDDALGKISWTFGDIFTVYTQDVEQLSKHKLGLAHEAARENAQAMSQRLLHTPYSRLAMYVDSEIIRSSLMLPIAIEDEPRVANLIQNYMSSKLNERDQHIIEKRFGLKSWNYATREYAAEMAGISTARVQQIENKFITAMRVDLSKYLPAFTTNYIDSFAADLGIRYVKDLPTITTPLIPEDVFTLMEIEEIEKFTYLSRQPENNNNLFNVLSTIREGSDNTDLQQSIANKLRRYIRIHNVEAIFGDQMDSMKEPFDPKQLALSALLTVLEASKNDFDTQDKLPMQRIVKIKQILDAIAGVSE